MYIKEAGMQSISNYGGKRHHFNFKSVIETLPVVVSNKVIFTDPDPDAEAAVLVNSFVVGSAATENNDAELRNTYRLFRYDTPQTQETGDRQYYLTPTKNIYIFTDPIMDFSSITLQFRNFDRAVSFKPCVYENVPLTFLGSGTLDGFEYYGANNLGGATRAYMTLIIPGHDLVAGDYININNTLAVVMGSYDMIPSIVSSFNDASYTTRLNTIVINPLFSVLVANNSPSIPVVYVKVFVHKRRINVPIRMRRLVNRRTNNIISTS
jgi:hypothetical protein